MPNWCMNSLKVTGEKKERKRFEQGIKDKNKKFSFNKVIPYPKKFAKLDEKAREIEDKREAFIVKLQKKGEPENIAREKAWAKYPHVKDGYNQGGYDWCVANWGTKWDVDEVSKKTTPLYTQYSFVTAWSPPLAGILTISKKYPRLTFCLDYEEPGMCFFGTFICKNGMIIEEIEQEMTPKTHKGGDFC